MEGGKEGEGKQCLLKAEPYLVKSEFIMEWVKGKEPRVVAAAVLGLSQALAKSRGGRARQSLFSNHHRAMCVSSRRRRLLSSSLFEGRGMTSHQEQAHLPLTSLNGTPMFVCSWASSVVFEPCPTLLPTSFCIGNSVVAREDVVLGDS